LIKVYIRTKNNNLFNNLTRILGQDNYQFVRLKCDIGYQTNSTFVLNDSDEEVISSNRNTDRYIKEYSISLIEKEDSITEEFLESKEHFVFRNFEKECAYNSECFKISDDSIIIYDLTNANDNSDWEKLWSSLIDKPRNLLVNNIKVIGVIKHSLEKFPLDLLNNYFFDFIYYSENYDLIDKARLLGTVINCEKSIINEIELKSLNNIGIELSVQSDLDRLLKRILTASMDLTNSDGGSIYLVIDEKSDNGEKMMQFEHSLNDTLGEFFKKFQLPINDKSISGYAVKTGKSLNIDDVYKIPLDRPYSFNSNFDRINNYITRSMLTVPMINHRNEIIGAIQLINRKKEKNTKLDSKENVDKYVIDFDHKCELLIRSLGSQATISIETVRLYKEIHNLFESFMNASVVAVESRDPSTGGHSKRVSKLSVAIANHINMSSIPELSNLSFSVNDILTIKYAGLLHDFGKIGVQEKILLKAKKLFEEELKIIETKLELYKLSMYAYESKDVNYINSKVSKIKEAVMLANEPGYYDDNIFKMLYDESNDKIKLLDDRYDHLIDKKELDILLNARGSLSSEEYEIIKKHVDYSYNFLTMIAWPKGFERVPEIARFHHEKLDGSGYPLGLKGDEIPIESQIMCIADIFDALISKDRAYKKKMPLEKALSILQKEAETGKINKTIFKLFVEDKIYEVVFDNEDL